jgi:hypothetical protein
LRFVSTTQGIVSNAALCINTPQHTAYNAATAPLAACPPLKQQQPAQLQKLWQERQNSP